MTPREVSALLRGTGCTDPAPMSNGFWGVACGTPENKLRLLEKLAQRDVAADAGARATLASLRLPPGRAALARALHAHVRDTVPFVPERVETFKSTARTLREGGDCDDSSRALIVLARLAGLRARFRPLEQCKGGVCAKTHVAAEIHDGSGWHWAETTLDAGFGEHPLAAYRRLKRTGRVVARADLGVAGLGVVEPRRTLLAIPGIEKTSEAFRAGLVELADRIGIDPDWLSAVMSIESNYRPDVQNPSSHATGLIQFLPSTAKALGTSVDALKAMTDAEQLPWVEKYLKPFAGHMKAGEDVYAAVFWPAAVGKGSANVIAKDGDKVYAANAGLDKDRNGAITNGDLGAHVEARLAKGRERPPLEVDAPASALSGKARWPLWVLGTLGIGAVVAAVWDAWR